MEKVYYKDFDEFESAINPYKTMDCNEGVIYFTKNYVYKLLTKVQLMTMEQSCCSSKEMNSISKLDDNIITRPLFLLHFYNKYGEKFNKCSGFAMKDGGENLWDLLLNDSLSFEEKKDIAHQMKSICSYLIRKRYIHGDIKLENFVYKDGILRLTDINNMKKNPNIRRNNKKLRMPQLYEMWYLKCEDGFYIDYLAINFTMYILLNFNLDDIIKIIRNNSDGFRYDYEKILDSENKVFDNEIIKRMKSTIENIEERKLKKEFLVDYLIY